MTTESDAGLTPPIPPDPPPPIIEIPERSPSDSISFNPMAEFKGDVLHILKVLLARNPFYIISAMLLLWSMRSLSLDSRVFHQELSQLVFNFSSFQVYEFLLAGTAIALARRRIWYDSGLLVALENLFVCVPFLLVSQELLLENSFATALCVASGVFVIVRGNAMKRRLRAMNLPSGWLWAGAGLLLFNLAWPVMIRMMHKDVAMPDWDRRGLLLTALSWNWLVPIGVALAAWLPLRDSTAEFRQGEEAPFYSWKSFPTLLLLMWVAGTSVHLYCVSYVYGLPWSTLSLAPAIWVMSWVIWKRWRELFPGKWGLMERLLSLTPLVIVFSYSDSGRATMCLTLAAVNALVYAALALSRRDVLARYLGVLSALLALYFMPHPVVIGAGVSLARFLGGGMLIFAIGWAVVSARPGIGLLGGACLGTMMAAVWPHFVNIGQLAFQAAFIFVLLHSMRWNPDSSDASRARIFCGAYWFLVSAIWVLFEGPNAGLISAASGVSVAVVYVCARGIFGRWPSLTILSSAVAVALFGPGFYTANELSNAPRGLLLLGGSFALFGLGTAAALAKAKWIQKNTAPKTP